MVNSKGYIYKELDKEFKFNFDPCPYPFERDGIEIDWGSCNWVNPPFRSKDAINGHGPTAFVRKAIEESKKGKTSVLILPVQSYVNAITGLPYKTPSTNALFILRGVTESP